MSCQQCAGIEEQFDPGEARKKLRRLRRRGPDATTRLLIEALRQVLGSNIVDTTLLDIGGGVGAIHHDLLDGPVGRAVHVDASSAYLAAAREEADRRGHSARVEFQRGDFVELAGRLSAADVVTLDRVICCYHDMERLVRLSAAKATRVLGAVYPRRSWWTRLAFAGSNLVLRARRSEFRVFVHDPAAIHAVLDAAGLKRRTFRRTLVWEVVVFGR
jgi:magnesium-protoporphyrin O-methyltransferase